MKKATIGVLILLAALVGALLLWQIRNAASHRVTQETEPAPVSVVPPTAAPAVVVPAMSPAIKFPVQATVTAATGTSPLPNLEDFDAYIEKALSAMLGSKIVRGQLQLSDFVHKCVATVDNLGRAQAPSILWPVNTTPGRFASMIAEGKVGAGKEVILDGNDVRYAPFVNMIDSIDMSDLANLYFHLYPLFQQQYEELGFPQEYFNDRLMQVLDLLIATPEPPRPIEVHLVAVEGSIKSLQPWVRYEFVDPALQNLTSGQKIVLRIGKLNGEIVRHKMIEFRKLVAARANRNETH